MNDKYELIPEGELFRVRALRDFGTVKAGDIGGLVSGEHNLSTEGSAWVFDNARVSGSSRVFGNAQVFDDAQVSGNAWVSGNAQVFDNAWVSGSAWVSGNARVSGSAQVSGNARAFDNAWVSGNARVSGADYMTIGPIGSRNSTLTVTRDKSGELFATTGCFHGTLEEFAAAVEETHADNEHGKAYTAAIAFIKITVATWPEASTHEDS